MVGALNGLDQCAAGKARMLLRLEACALGNASVSIRLKACAQLLSQREAVKRVKADDGYVGGV